MGWKFEGLERLLEIARTAPTRVEILSMPVDGGWQTVWIAFGSAVIGAGLGGLISHFTTRHFELARERSETAAAAAELIAFAWSCMGEFAVWQSKTKSMVARCNAAKAGKPEAWRFIVPIIGTPPAPDAPSTRAISVLVAEGHANLAASILEMRRRYQVYYDTQRYYDQRRDAVEETLRNKTGTVVDGSRTISTLNFNSAKFGPLLQEIEALKSLAHAIVESSDDNARAAALTTIKLADTLRQVWLRKRLPGELDLPSAMKAMIERNTKSTAKIG